MRSMVPRRKFSSGPNGVVQAHSTVFVCSHCRRSGPCCSTNASAVMSDFISRWRLAAICALRGVALGGTQRNVRFARRWDPERQRTRSQGTPEVPDVAFPDPPRALRSYWRPGGL